jgi:hypothetical protein
VSHYLSVHVYPIPVLRPWVALNLNEHFALHINLLTLETTINVAIIYLTSQIRHSFSLVWIFISCRYKSKPITLHSEFDFTCQWNTG